MRIRYLGNEIIPRYHRAVYHLLRAFIRQIVTVLFY